MHTAIGIRWTSAFLAALGLCSIGSQSNAQELIKNGGFESGGLTDWQSVSQPGGTGGFSANSDGTMLNPFRSTVGSDSGSFYAVSDQAGDGSHALIQAFTLPTPADSVVLSFDMFVDNYNGDAATAPSLDYTVVPNQQARVDLLSATAGVFDTGAGVLQNFYTGSDPVSDPNLDNPHSYTHYTFDITSLVKSGGSYQLRFAEVNNQNNLYQGIDNISVLETPAVPEASTMVSFGLLLLTLVGAGGLRLHSRKKAERHQ